MKQFYVYIYFDPRNDEPFYVGKGFGWRYKRHLTKYATNKHLKNRITAIQRAGLQPIITPFLTVDEAQAFEMERDFIKEFGRRDQGTGTLCNYTDGGEGSSGRKGFKHSEETKKHLSQKLKGREMTEEHRAKIGAARKGHVNGPESFEKAKRTRAANPIPRKPSKPPSKEHLARMTELAAIKTRGIKRSQEHKDKISKSNKNRVVSDETRAKMSISQLRRQEKERAKKCG